LINPDVVDQAEQMVATAANGFQIFPLVGGQGRVAMQHLGKSQNDIQGGMQLVAHVSQKQAFGRVGRLSVFHGLPENHFFVFAIANILANWK
jgi:hypothetical protein